MIALIPIKVGHEIHGARGWRMWFARLTEELWQASRQEWIVPWLYDRVLAEYALKEGDKLGLHSAKGSRTQTIR